MNPVNGVAKVGKVKKRKKKKRRRVKGTKKVNKTDKSGNYNYLQSFKQSCKPGTFPKDLSKHSPVTIYRHT